MRELIYNLKAKGVEIGEEIARNFSKFSVDMKNFNTFVHAYPEMGFKRSYNDGIYTVTVKKLVK